MKFLEHFALIAEALDDQGLWDDEDGFFYDRLRRARRLDDADAGAVDGRHPAAARRGGGRTSGDGATR